MTVIGNILLVLVSIVYFMLVSTLGKAPPRGDYAVGYAWSVLIMNTLLIVGLGIVTCIIGWKGGFQWIRTGTAARFLIVSVGLASTLATTILSGLLKYENGPVPVLLKFFSGFAPILIPLTLIITAFILLNDTLRTQVPRAVYQWPLTVVFVLGVTGCANAAIGFIQENRRNQLSRANETVKQQDENHERILREIDSCDVSKNMVFILVFTDANQDDDVRAKAVAKIKTNPKWQQELINRLQNDWAPEAFNFLASNEVDDPALFTEPVKQGVMIQAKLIRENIKRCSHPSNFYEGQFLWEVERVLKTIDKFSSNNTDYRAAVKQLRAALDEPSDFEKPAFLCATLLDDWIKEHP